MKKHSRVFKIIRMMLIVFFASACCGGLAILVFRTIAEGAPLTGDAWLSFWGSIIGSVVAMLGIVLTLSYENKHNNTVRRMEAQPIILLKELTLDSEQTENEGAYDLEVFLPDSEGDEELLRFDFPDIEVKNIGLNFATKINLDFEFEGGREWYLSCGSRDLSILDAKETKQITVKLEVPKEYLYKLFDRTCIPKEDEFPDAGYMRTLAFLARSNRKESQDRIEKVSCAAGGIRTTFCDIYGNTYEQKRGVIFHYVELRGEEPFCFMSMPEFSQAKLIK